MWNTLNEIKKWAWSETLPTRSAPAGENFKRSMHFKLSFMNQSSDVIERSDNMQDHYEGSSVRERKAGNPLRAAGTARPKWF